MAFVSELEKKYWLLASLVVAAIFASLIFGPYFVEGIESLKLQAILFGMGMVLILSSILLYAKNDGNWSVRLVFLAILAVYILLFLRLGLAERTHLIEFSVLAIFIDCALREREKVSRNPGHRYRMAFAIPFSIGVLDELIQFFLPQRVFDLNDILFNTGAILLALGSRWTLQLIKKRWPVSGPPR